MKPMVLVIWEDARVLTDGAWSEKTELDYVPYLVHQIGFLIKEDPDGIHLTEAIAPEHYGPIEQIPRGMIREIKFLQAK